MEIFILVAIVLLIVFFLYKNGKSKEKTTQTVIKSKPYAAVNINPCNYPCSAVFDYSLRVFLAREAPKLPLDECDKTEKCRCRFIHYDDRRQSDELRRSSSPVLRDTFTGEEKRLSRKKGRRKDD